MRKLAVLALIACGPPKPETTHPAPAATSAETPKPVEQPKPVEEPKPPPPEVLTADTPKTTTGGNTFVAPAGWSFAVRGSATILTAPENDSTIAFVDTDAKNADHAIELGWIAFGKKVQWPIRNKSTRPDRDGWTQTQCWDYNVPPNEKRSTAACARFANNMWSVTLEDLANATAEKRGAQLGVLYGQFLPKGGQRESFAGKKAHPLDKARIAELSKFVETAQKALGVPGVSIGIVQDGKVVFAGGFGVRELGKPAKVDADTKYVIASNTKAMTTLMLAKLVDEKKLTWEGTATSLLPQFKLGDADTTSKVLVKHLICACTGLPRQDMEMILEYGRNNTPDKVLASLATMQPTSKFGELFQYSNPLAAAAGFIGGHVAFPKLELGKAYDEAMRTRVFAPLGMTNTTFDFKRAQTGNYAMPHAPDVDGKTSLAPAKVNELVVPVRPAGGAWSNVRDVLKYVQMELAEGKVGAKQYISKDVLLARRAAQVATSKDSHYGMGLSVNTRFGVTVVNHGGDVIGFHSDMMWLPEHGVGAVVLTNGDPGWIIRGVFQRKLLEVLFDGKPEADATVADAAKNWFNEIETTRKLLTIPAAEAEAAKLAGKYANDALGEITVTRAGGKTTFDFGEWKSEIASRKNPDGTITFVTITPGLSGIELHVGAAENRKTLVLRDPQHEYVFTER